MVCVVAFVCAGACEFVCCCLMLLLVLLRVCLVWLSVVRSGDGQRCDAYVCVYVCVYMRSDDAWLYGFVHAWSLCVLEASVVFHAELV